MQKVNIEKHRVNALLRPRFQPKPLHRRQHLNVNVLIALELPRNARQPNSVTGLSSASRPKINLGTELTLDASKTAVLFHQPKGFEVFLQIATADR